MRLLWLLAASVLAALGLAVPAAHGAQSRLFFGETARGGDVRAEAFPGGRFGNAVVTFSVRCRKAGVTARGSVGFEGSLVERSRREFSGTGTNDVDETGFDASVEGAMTGRRHVPGGRPGLERWSGLLEIEVTLRREDRIVERCGFRDARWTARRESFGRFAWTMTGDAGDYINGGETVTYGRRDELVAYGDRKLVHFGVNARNGDDWTADFAAPPRDRLVPGRTYTAERYPFHAPAAGLDVSGNGRGCNNLTGTFTVEQARFDRHGRMLRFVVRFEQHCEGSTPALRGRLSFRATLR